MIKFYFCKRHTLNCFYMMEFSETLEAERLKKKIYKSVKFHSKRYISPAVLRQIYRQFRDWRRLTKRDQRKYESETEPRSISAFECDILKYLLERCFWIRYGDNDVVSYLLSAAYYIMNDLGKVFDYRDSNKFWLFGSNCRIIGSFNVKSTWIAEKVAPEAIKPVDYFLEHANKRRLLFGGRRFSEQYFASSRIAAQAESLSCLFLPPCSLSFQYPELLPKLLKYGLFVNAGPKDLDVGKLLTGIIGVFLNYPSEYTLHCGDFASEYTERIRTMGDHLLRSVKSVDPQVLLKSQTRSGKGITVLLDKLRERGVLVKLKERCGGPQRLQHLCRCRIRRHLYDNWLLPSGVQRLPLPETLKEYLSLEVD